MDHSCSPLIQNTVLVVVPPFASFSILKLHTPAVVTCIDKMMVLGGRVVGLLFVGVINVGCLFIIIAVDVT